MTKRFLTPAGSTDLNLGAVILAGGTAGVAMWAIAIPPDVRIENSYHISRPIFLIMTHLIRIYSSSRLILFFLTGLSS